MRKLIRYIIAIIVFALLLLIAMGNNSVIEITLFPSWIPLIGGWNVSAPVFVFLFIAFFIGVICGFIYAALRTIGTRYRASRSKSALKKAERELADLKSETGNHDDDVLAILK